MDDPFSIPSHFDLGEGELAALTRLGRGHINDTFLGSIREPSGRMTRYVFQRINQTVFPDVDALMENVRRVTERLNAGEGSGQRSLTLIPTLDGGDYYRDPTGDCWRSFPFVEGTTVVDVVSSEAQAKQAGRAFGEFSRSLSSLPPPPLREVLPDFHNTQKRFADFLAAVDADPVNRAAGVAPEIDAAMSGSSSVPIIADAQAAGSVPQRTAHNDAKIENVLLDAETGDAVCVVDLDTVMPGTVLHDFGDLVRTATATCSEDEPDLERAGVSMVLFEALSEGFLSACGEVLTPTEIELLPLAGRLITYEQSLRFLTDYLLGDPYYKTRTENHNLDRTRNQQRLVEHLDAHEADMRKVIQRLSQISNPVHHPTGS